jgi:GrpB-like predicted nucleotidyltransferase (UPF0157 family)
MPTRDFITVVEYDPRWPRMLEQEKARVAAALGPVVIDVEHFGSTAVPGLAAKPVIDLMVGVDQLGEHEAYGDLLTPLGYEWEAVDDADRWFFRRGNPRTHHVHVVEASGWHHWRYIAFRERLRADSRTAREYERLKRGLADKFSDHRVAYTESKSHFIRSTVLQELLKHPDLLAKWESRVW